MIRYSSDGHGVRPEALQGFFEGWPDPPPPEVHAQLLASSAHVVIALDEADRVVGFVTAISDGLLHAYVTLLEVLPEYRERGIGSELLRRMLAQLKGLYSVSLHCDPAIEPFYRSHGLDHLGGMALRDYSAQSGVSS